MSERITEDKLKELEQGWGEGYWAEQLVAEVRRLRALIMGCGRLEREDWSVRCPWCVQSLDADNPRHRSDCEWAALKAEARSISEESA